MATETSKRPFRDFASLRERFDRFFDEVTHRGGEGDDAWSMAMDVQHAEDALTLRADMPGLEPGDISITVEDGVLTISGAHEETSESDEEGFVRRERRYGSFRRTMALPPEAKADAITATCRNGVVDVTVPLGEKPAGQKIEITPTAG